MFSHQLWRRRERRQLLWGPAAIASGAAGEPFLGNAARLVRPIASFPHRHPVSDRENEAEQHLNEVSLYLTALNWFFFSYSRPMVRLGRDELVAFRCSYDSFVDNSSLKGA